MSVLRLEDVSIGYDGVPAVRDVNLTVADGAVTAILGPNGSGKSTLVRGILGLASVLSGSVQMVPRRQIGYVPQRQTVGGGVAATVAEVVATGLLAGRPWWKPLRAAQARQVDAAIAQVGLSGQADRDIALLSGGQQRRALVARALVNRPRLVIMDEPTAGVDSYHQAALAQTIKAIAEQGVSVVVVTHEFEPVADLVTQAVVLREGRISYDGPLAGLVDEPHDGHHPDDGAHSGGWTPEPTLT